MSTATKAKTIDAMDIDSRIDAYPWPNLSKHLDAHGWAMLHKLLTASECEAVAGLYTDDHHFRSHIVMARHGFGRGEYKYFSYPLPDKVADLRTALYPRLAPIANRWNASMGIDVRYPDAHEEEIHQRIIDAVVSVPATELAHETRWRRRMRLDTYGHYPKHTEAIRRWRAQRQASGLGVQPCR